MDFTASRAIPDYMVGTVRFASILRTGDPLAVASGREGYWSKEASLGAYKRLPWRPDGIFRTLPGELDSSARARDARAPRRLRWRSGGRQWRGGEYWRNGKFR